ncbi:MAG: heavy metal translocating P-type ATPase [Candidatus Aminicenantes bacterium]|nr:heavy metal translocating P-type ATPase [Candidatus Aminicenantes bacterium]
MLKDFKFRFWISLGVSVPVLILSPFIQSLIGYELDIPGGKYILFGLATFIYFFGGWPFFKGLVQELKKRQPGMMTLIGLAITVAYGYSSLVIFGVPGKIFFWELVTLIDVMLLGHWLEMRSIQGASSALEELTKLMPSEVHLIDEDGQEKEVPLEEVDKGDIVLVKPGEKIPVDGEITEGESEIDESMITGESKPAGKKTGDEVVGGSINGTGALKVEVTKTGEESYLSQVVEMVKKAGESKSKVQTLADKAAFWLTVIALAAGAMTLAGWLLAGQGFAYALERMVTVMVITCPHALGLAIPLVITAITALSARNGLLIRNRSAFEGAWDIDVMVFDKTGTLTKGEFGVTDIIDLSDSGEEEILKKAASVESRSEHSIAKGVVNKMKEKELVPSEINSFEAIPGKGAKAEIDGEMIYVGNKGILEQLKNIEMGGSEEKAEKLSSQGKTSIYVASEKKLLGIIGLEDIIREESKEAVEKLQAMGMDIAMITGDNQETAKKVADELGIVAYFSGVLPDKKSDKIAEIQGQGKRVAMVGDGVNDAPALAKADVGIAFGAGTDVALETADVILVENDPQDVVDIIRLSKATRRKMKQNLAWATGYNVIAIPLAAGVLYNIGIVMPPAVGALVMSVSTIIVAINAKLISI